jgi:hypothetical protein
MGRRDSAPEPGEQATANIQPIDMRARELERFILLHPLFGPVAPVSPGCLSSFRDLFGLKLSTSLSNGTGEAREDGEGRAGRVLPISTRPNIPPFAILYHHRDSC